MSRWFLELVQDHDGSYYANMAVEGMSVKGLPENVDYNTLRDAIREKTGIEILNRKEMEFQRSGRKKYAYIDATQYRQDCRVTLNEMKQGWMPNFKTEYKVYRQNESDCKAFYNAIHYWSNALGELHYHGKYDITEEELPRELQHAYEDLFFEGNIGSLRYLVETDKGFGIALINEYDECYANDCGLSMDDLFQSALKDAAKIAQEPIFEIADIYLAEFMGFDNSHELAVVFPADIETETFMTAAAKLDTFVYQAAKTFQKPSLAELIQSAQDISANSLEKRISMLKGCKGYEAFCHDFAILKNTSGNSSLPGITASVWLKKLSALSPEELHSYVERYKPGLLDPSHTHDYFVGRNDPKQNNHGQER